MAGPFGSYEMKRVVVCALAGALIVGQPQHALAWGNEGHQVVAAIAQSYLTPRTRQRVEALLAADADARTAHDLLSAATWADAWRTDHRETSDWHFANVELDGPDLKSACYGFPPSARPVSTGPAKDCVVDRVNAFAAELKDLATPQPERIMALKFLLHFVGDIHQPLHVADNHDRGGNCVQVSLGGARTANLHHFWDTVTVETLGPDPVAVAAKLRASITADEKRRWERGDPDTWAQEGFLVAKSSVYTFASHASCDQAPPAPLPAGYAERAAPVAGLQLQRAGVRLAYLLNWALGS
jgi:hypothetical protein